MSCNCYLKVLQIFNLKLIDLTEIFVLLCISLVHKSHKVHLKGTQSIKNV